MVQPLVNPRISFTQPYEGIWHVSLDGKHVGTVNGDSVAGFTARDTEYHTVGRGYASTEAAMQVWVPAPISHA